MPMVPWYEEWFDSPYYHVLYFHHNEQEANGLVKKLVDYLRPPAGSRMIDVACGKGRHAILLAEYGFDVTGIDLSENSINYARRFENDRLHFYKHDMRRPFWINYFGYAFNFFTSFGYFRSRRDNENAIRTMSDSLQSRGILVLDYLNSRYVERHLVPEESKVIKEIKFFINRWQDEKFFFKRIEIEDPSRTTGNLVFTEQIQKFGFGDFNEMFAYYGLQILEIFGDYQLGKFDLEHSRRLLLIARKK